MTISSSVARQVCTKAELKLVSESRARNVGKLDAKALKSRVSRARKLRDKYNELANSQDREARGKQAPRRTRSAQGSLQTRRKEQLFAETLDRFEKQLVKLESAKSKGVAKKTRKRKPAASASGSKAKKKAAKKTKQSAKTVKKKASTKNKAAKKVTKKAAKKRATAKAAAKKTISEKTTTSSKLKPTTPASNRKAKTAATKARRKASGKIRRDKHLSAQNRRKQAGRDAR